MLGTWGVQDTVVRSQSTVLMSTSIKGMGLRPPHMILFTVGRCHNTGPADEHEKVSTNTTISVQPDQSLADIYNQTVRDQSKFSSKFTRDHLTFSFTSCPREQATEK